MTKAEKIEALKEIISASGLKKGYLAQKCGLSRTSFNKKENGLVEWTAPEISVLKSELGMNMEQIDEVLL